MKACVTEYIHMSENQATSTYRRGPHFHKHGRNTLHRFGRPDHRYHGIIVDQASFAEAGLCPLIDS